MPTDPLPIATARLILRRFDDSDLACFEAYRSDPEVARFQSWSIEELNANEFFEKQRSVEFAAPGEWFQIAIAARDTHQLVGDVGICVQASNSMTAEIGFTLSRQEQGKGLAAEALGVVVKLIFETTQVERIEAITDARNLPSIRLLGRLGMQRAKTDRVEFKGEPCEEWTFAMARSMATRT